MEKTEINSIGDLTIAINHAEKKFGVLPWWRGQSDAEWGLVPSVFRDKNRTTMEAPLLTEFQRHAPVLYEKCPNVKYWADWVFLAQHYRLYTRLLDWTESILTAAFFALSENDSRPATIWALDAGGLNSLQEMDRSVLFYTGSDVDYLFKGAFGIGSPPSKKQRILAVAPSLVDKRMHLQSSVFTIHGGDYPLDTFPNNEQIVIQFIIPAAAKKTLKVELTRLGITQASLFPDLENLALFLNTNYTA